MVALRGKGKAKVETQTQRYRQRHKERHWRNRENHRYRQREVRQRERHNGGRKEVLGEDGWIWCQSSWPVDSVLVRIQTWVGGQVGRRGSVWLSFWDSASQ